MQFEQPKFSDEIKNAQPVNAAQTPSGQVVVRVPDVGPVLLSPASFWQNWKTITFNLGVLVLLAVLTLLTTIDWTQYVSPTAALFIVTIVNAVLRGISAVTGAGPAGSNVVVQKLSL